MKIIVLIDDEETGLIEGSIIHLDEDYENKKDETEYEGIHSSMAGSYKYMVSKKICAVLPDNWDTMGYWKQTSWMNEMKRELKIDDVLNG